jgi:3-methyladenine DNA glycosylase Mpg
MSSGPIARLGREDFNRPTLHVARDLLGKVIAVRAGGGRVRRGMIVETEAYRGPRDLASHAAGGRRTRRVEPLYGEGGTVYVYLVYGIHWLLNFATAGAGLPEGVLIRGVLADPDGDSRLVLRTGPRHAAPRDRSAPTTAMTSPSRSASGWRTAGRGSRTGRSAADRALASIMQGPTGPRGHGDCGSNEETARAREHPCRSAVKIRHTDWNEPGRHDGSPSPDPRALR